MRLYTPTGVEPLQAMRHRLRPLGELRGPAVADFPAAVGEIVLIASSSRGGSSMVAEMLRESASLLHLTAELNPFLRLAGLAHHVGGSGSDQLNAEHLAGLAPDVRRMLGDELARDVGCAADRVDDRTYALDLAWRLTVQWPALPVDPVHVAGTAERVLSEVRARHGWAPGEVRAPGTVFLALCRELAHQGVAVDPRFYDLPAHQLAQAPRVHGALGELLVEEPPFVLPRPWRHVGAADVRDRPLVIKTPSNVYRMDFLRALFPNARFRVLHLTRNPAAAVNGLYDGWRHRGFHAHRMAEPLAIQGYVEQDPQNRWWWKFDLPPGWRRYTDRPLLDVCAFQWRSSHRAVLDDLAASGTDCLTLRFEDLISTPASRIAVFEELCAWLGIPMDGALRKVVHEGIGPVVATAAPEAARWRGRAALIEPSLGPQTLEVAEHLGYGDRSAWI
ncbi:sulfotransferase [Streptomyces sp. NBC_00820]|uniref:sulfotransferase family protein n=1 Tax=Streptomyces sp. NBC_00820 TaxID=2975842 RepID=UPI002ED46203|nr:sulfotransferase [Streptomyces sp. NBC_00820]